MYMENTAKNFALQLGSLISLSISIVALITLLSGVITLQYPDVANGYWEQESASSSIRFSIAMLFVFFPTYIALTRMVNTIRRVEQGVYLALTKWLIYLSLLIGGGAILGDLVSVINAFLNGELTVRFILKALVFLFVIGSAFVYYVLDVRGYWQHNEKGSLRYAGVISLSVIISLCIGYLNIEAPTQVREMKIDAQQINDLSNIQSHIESYVYLNAKLPESIDVAFNGIAIPEATEERNAYIYTITKKDTYTLCAEFAFESVVGVGQFSEPIFYEDGMQKNVYTWEHGAGDWCFERVVDIHPEK